MCTEMQFTGIFLLFGTFMCLPTLYASVLPSGEEMDFIHANAQTQARAFSSIRQLKDISDVVNEGKKFLHNTQSKDALKSKVPFKCALALTHSNLTKEIFKQMDRNLQIMIQSSMYMIGELIQQKGVNNLKFEDYMRVMMNNKYIRQKPRSEIERKRTLRASYSGISDGRRQTSVAKRLESWYKGDLIRDRDIIKSIDINLEDFKNIVAATGAAVNSFETFFYANIRINRDVVDVGILRYPGLGDSSFKLYRIKLSAFRYTKRILFVEETSSGIHGTFNMHEFIPNDGAMEKMDPTLRDRFLKSALDFLLEF